MSDLVLIFLSACLVNNLVLDQLIGVAPAVTLSRRVDVAAVVAISSIAVAGIAAAAAWLLRVTVLEPLDLQHLELIALVAATSILVVFGASLLRRRPGLAARTEALVPLLLGNCTVLGVALLGLEQVHGFLAAVFFGLGAGTGLALVLAMLFALQDRSGAADIPQPLRGAPITLLTLALLSMTFMGFTGLTGL